MDLLKMVLIFGFITIVSGKVNNVLLRSLLERYLLKLRSGAPASLEPSNKDKFSPVVPLTTTVAKTTTQPTTTMKPTTTPAPTTTTKKSKTVLVLCDNFCIYNSFTERFNKQCGDFKRKGVRCLLCRYDFKCGGTLSYFA